ncbi:MAG: hypothetical protein D6727_12275, partial [Gammaproteobacteria bacterium]
GRETIGADDDFFALGGHSLLALQLIARIREQTGRELPPARLFAEPTIRGIAAAVADLPAAVRQPALVARPRRGAVGR